MGRGTYCLSVHNVVRVSFNVHDLFVNMIENCVNDVEVFINGINLLFDTSVDVVKSVMYYEC